MRRTRTLVILLALVLVGGFLAGPTLHDTVAQDATPGAAMGGTAFGMADHPVVGTWLLDTDADDPENAPEVTIFTSDGAYSSVDAEGDVTTGAWQLRGERTAELIIVSPGNDDEGAFFGTIIVRAVIDVDESHETFTAQYTVEFVAADGTASGEYGPATATATRIEVEAMGTPVGPIEELFELFAEEGTPEAGTPAA